MQNLTRLFLLFAFIASLIITNKAQGFNRRCPANRSPQRRPCHGCPVTCPRNQICCPVGCGYSCVTPKPIGLPDPCGSKPRPRPKNVRFKCNFTRRPSTCKVSCKSGYYLTDNTKKTIKCHRRKGWKKGLKGIKCKKDSDTCDSLPPRRRNVRFDCEYIQRQSRYKCTVSCEYGYHLTDNTKKTVTCRRRKGWKKSLEGIKCKKGYSPQCPTSSFPPWIYTSYTSYTPWPCSQCPTTCPRNQICCPAWCGSSCVTPTQINTCAVPQKPNVRFSCDSTSRPSTCTVSCERGYYLIGNREIQCRQGRWENLGGIACVAINGNSCPFGIPTAQCFADPCLRATCPPYQGLTCRDAYCESCRAIFTDFGGNQVFCD